MIFGLTYLHTLPRFRTACELNAEHGLSVPIRGMDLFHVAIAIEVGADALLTFDEEQQELAKATGVRVVGLAAGPRRSTGK
jgi:predicted nucleic acid-binding protein